MPTTVKQLFEKLDALLQDEDHASWTLKELIGWLNSAGKELVLLKPTALPSNGNMELVAGTKQTISATALGFGGLVRNMGVDGATPGRAIKEVSRDVLDATIPDWHTTTPAAAVKYFTRDPLDPKTFYVYPPQPSSPSKVEAVTYIPPADIDYADENLSSYTNVNALGGAGLLDDIYENAFLDYLLYRCYLKDGEDGSDNRALMFYNAFRTALGAKQVNELALAKKAPQQGAPNAG